MVCDGAIAFTQGFGVVRQGDDVPVTETTRFQIASTTKMFTGALGAALHADGVVDLHAPVDLPGITTDGATLHQLLAHTAGYPTTFPGGDYSSLELDEFFANNGHQPLWSPPGEVWNYSNLGMSLAGLAMEEAAGEPFADLVGDRIFAPAGMDGASMHADEVEAAGDFAWGHSVTAANPTVTAPTDSYYGTGYYGPMGGAWAGVRDLAAWAVVHLDGGGDVMDADAMASLAAPVALTGQAPTDSYGQGLFVDELYGVPHLHHGGSVGGFLTSWSLIPSEEFGVFAVVNGDWYWPGWATREAIGLFTDLPPIDPGTWTLSDRPLEDYAGTYDDPVEFGPVEIRVEGDSLVADFPDHGFERTITRTFDDSFALDWPPGGTTLYGSFQGGDDGPFGYLVTRWGVATRLPSRR